MKFYVGTSGWVYTWNPDGLEWYLENSGLNTVELNSSFYRFPYPNQVGSWLNKTRSRDFRWSIKIHMSISHRRLLTEKSLYIWDKFYKLFKPLDEKISFYLLQMPPRFIKNEKNILKLKNFLEYTGLGPRLAVEFRHESWFNEDTVEISNKLGITLVSIDSPETYYIWTSGRYLYLRMHGRTFWYSHNYSLDELIQVIRDIRDIDVDEAYIYFNIF